MKINVAGFLYNGIEYARRAKVHDLLARMAYRPLDFIVIY